MDGVYELPYARGAAPGYGDAKIPAWEMIRFSVTIMRGCFGGCTFCSITEHEGRIIQSRSEDSVLQRDRGHPRQDAGLHRRHLRHRRPDRQHVPHGLQGPRHRSRLPPPVLRLSRASARTSNTSHDPLISLYRKARELPGIKKVHVASGVRYDLAVKSPAYVKELVTHHVGGYLKIAPEHTEDGPLSKMMKPGIGAYERFKQLFDAAAKEAGKKYFLIPYFIAAHPGTTDEDMLHLALWLKKNKYRADQVQTFLPSPMALATAMYHSGKNPLKAVRRGGSEEVETVQGPEAAAPAQGVPALPRPRELAAAARGAEGHGPRRPDRPRQAPAGAALAAGRHRPRGGEGRRRAGSTATQTFTTKGVPVMKRARKQKVRGRGGAAAKGQFPPSGGLTKLA